MSVISYDPNSAATVNALTQAHILSGHIDALIEKLQRSRGELNDSSSWLRPVQSSANCPHRN